MRILQVNKFNYLRGGAEKSFLEIGKELELMGHDMAVFSMKHERNDESPWNKYFVSNSDFKKKNLINSLRVSLRILYNFEARRKFKKIVNDFNPDVVIYHNIYHQISPSILSVVKKKGIRSFMFLHDYKLICPNYKMFVRGKVCERCKGSKYYNCTLHRCMKNSLLQSLLITMEMYFHHKVLNIYQKNIDYYIAPSKFIKNKFTEFNWPGKNILVFPNFFPSDMVISKKEENYLLYFGRLSEEKGVSVAIEAIKGTKEKLKIVGEGPAYLELQKLVKKLKVEGQVEFLGYKKGDELNSIIGKSKAILFPSIWYENMPFSLLESMAMGKVVIASNIGGYPEVIENKKNGFLFKTGDSSDLKSVIENISKHNLSIIKKEALLTSKRINSDKYFRKLVSILNK